MNSARNIQSVWVGAACCLAIVGCSQQSPTPAVTPDSAPTVAAVEQQTSNDDPVGSVVQEVVQPSSEPRWQIVEKTDEMADTVSRFALYRAQVDATTVDVEMICPEQGADGALLQVTTHDGLLATAFDDVLGYLTAVARVDTGNGSIRNIALMNSEKYRNVYFYVNRGGVQIGRALAADIPILRDAPIGAGWLELGGDPANFKLELELDNGTKRVIRGDASLAQYLGPCTAEAEGQRQQQRVEEQRQQQEAAKQQQQDELDQWLRDQKAADEKTDPSAAPGEVEATPPSTE